MRLLKRKHAILGAAIILAAITGAFAVQLFTQTFPSITRPNPPPLLQTNCQTLVADPNTIPTVGTPGYIYFNCGGSTSAFKMIQTATVTPVFTLPTGYVSLWATATDCSNPTLGLQSGTPINLASGDYGYCALTDANTSALGTFAVTWVTGQKDNTSMSISCPSSIVAGQTGSCSVTVTDTTNSTIIPTGMVTFTSSDTTVGSVAASCTLDSSGVCNVSISGSVSGAPGVFSITGTYSGDAAHNGTSKTSGNIGVACNGICV